MYKINLNCDLGEGAAYDEQIIPLINSANIACGFHAGNHDMMDATAIIMLISVHIPVIPTRKISAEQILM